MIDTMRSSFNYVKYEIQLAEGSNPPTANYRITIVAFLITVDSSIYRFMRQIAKLIGFHDEIAH